ncbi:DNA repair protein, partial [Staphylococcus pseudintermedius]
VSLTQFMNENECNLELFTEDFQRLRQDKLEKTIDALQTKYRKGVVSKSITLTEAGTKYGRL